MPTGLITQGGADFADSENSSTASNLVPRKLLGEVIKSTRKKLTLRGLAARTFGPSEIPGRQLTIPLEKDGDFIDVNQVGELATVPLTDSDFTSITVTPVKYGARVGISREMEEDSLIGLAEMYAEQAGYKFAINEENLIVSALNTASSNASNDVSNSNATLPLSDVTEAMQNLEANNYAPTDFICGVEVANDIRNLDAFFEAQKSGGVNARQTNMIGQIYGMNVIVSPSVSAKLAYVIDRSQAFIIGEKRPLTVERYSEPQNDAGFVVATQRVAVSAMRDNAVSEITTT